MSFASDVKAKTVTATATAVNGRTRVQGVYYTCGATASTLTLRTGGAGGTVTLELKTPAAAGAYDLIIPDDGVLFEDGVHVTFADANVLSATVLFVGGAAA
jgi:hypothetical protein